MTPIEPFVLDLAENPHPKMLAEALRVRQNARTLLPNGNAVQQIALAYWRGYRAAMSDATGETNDAIEAWMDRASRESRHEVAT